MDTPTLPLREQVLENFCTHLARSVGHQSIKTYLCGVQAFSKFQGGQIQIASFNRLPYVLRGIKKTQGKAHARSPRIPINWTHLSHIYTYINYINSISNYDKHMWFAVVSLAFFGLLRVSEYTSPSAAIFDSSVHLTIDDLAINWHRQLMAVNIKMSKTDPFRLGTTIRIAANHSPFCPVRAMVRYLYVRPVHSGPLFVLADGRFLTRSAVSAFLRACFPGVSCLSTHSFRRGGASALANCGVPEHIIMLLGRWRSDAYRVYVQLSDEFISEVSQQLGAQAAILDRSHTRRSPDEADT